MRRSLMALFGFVCLTASFARADVFNGSGFNLVDGTATTTGVASGSIVVSGNGGTVGSINSVTVTGLTHTFIGDLDIFLIKVETAQQVALTSPPDLRSSNFNGTYTFLVNPGIQTIDEGTAALGDADVLSPGNYAISSYGGGTAIGPRTSFSVFSNLPIDGTWQLRVRDFAAGDTGAVASWSFDATIVSVPEPGACFMVCLGAFPAFIRYRRRRR
jgi:hypothetical protein